MTGAMSRNKGARFEREVIAQLQEIVDRQYRAARRSDAPKLRRNLVQYQEKGNADIAGLPWLALECKRCETLQLRQWWEQAQEQTEAHQITVLVWKQNRRPIQAMLWGKLEGLAHPPLKYTCTISWDSFLSWFTREVAERMLYA